jgi:alpha-galactosidase
MIRKSFPVFLLLFYASSSFGQVPASDGKILASTPPMGWMSWNYFAEKVNEKDLREIADAMVSSGMQKAGYEYLFIDDGWQGGRDNQNNIIPDPQKFPSGIKALADYVHSKGLKLGIYSDAAQLTCGGYTASLDFEEQDAKTFASWGIDYLKYDYCGAPQDWVTAHNRYKKMADALRKSGRDIVLGVCEWGNLEPWHWAARAGGQLWRTTADARDKWKSLTPPKNPMELHRLGAGILDIVDINADLAQYAGVGRWNDMDMIMAGLYGKRGPSGDLGGKGCTDVEYQTQMSLWSMMASVLATSNDIRTMNEATKRILLNEEIIAINQDALGKPAERKQHNETWDVFLKPLANGDFALAILNRGETAQSFNMAFSEVGLLDKYEIRDVWEHKSLGKAKNWIGAIQPHETKVFRLQVAK